MLALQQEIAGDIANKLRSKLSGAEKQQVTRQGTQNAEAYALYVKGRFHWNKRTATDINTAVDLFHQALEKDPSYALAYSGLADAYLVLANYGSDPNDVLPKADAAAEKALELDPTLAHPHAVLGGNKMEYGWDFAGGEADFRKAIELDPGDASAHQWFSEGLAGIGGRAQEAIDEGNRAAQLDPLSPVIAAQQAQAYASARQYEKAIELYKKLIAENPFRPGAPRAGIHLLGGAQISGNDSGVQDWRTVGRRPSRYRICRRARCRLPCRWLAGGAPPRHCGQAGAAKE